MKIRKFWKKAMLAAFASMWAGCDDGSSSAEEVSPTYGCGPCCDGNGCEVMPEYGVPYNPEEHPLEDSLSVDDSLTFVVQPMYGVVQDSLVNSVEEPEVNKMDAPIAVYGPPCYFDGSCREESSEENSGEVAPSVEHDKTK